MEKLLTTRFALSFNRSRGRYTLSSNAHTFEQTVCEFLQTVSFLVGKDVEEYLMNTAAEFDTVRIPLTGCGKLITLDLADFIALREMYSREMFNLRLEDMLMRQGIQTSRI